MQSRKRMNDRDRGNTGSVVFVDHSGLPGGGQLGLERYVGASDLTPSVVFATSGPVASRLASSTADVAVLSYRSGFAGYLSALPRLRGALRSRRPRLIVANSVKAATLLAALPRVRGTQYVYYLRDDMNLDRMSRAKWWFLAKVVMPRFDGFLANSEWTASTLPTSLRSRRMDICYPVSGVSADTLPAVASVPPLRIVSISRIARWKAIDTLLSALEILSSRRGANEISVTIAGGTAFGDEEYANALATAARALPFEVEFTGHVNDVDAVLRSAHVLVNCSRTPEPFGQTIVQGMARGLVVVATDQGGPREIITDGKNGYLVPPDNPAALAATIEMLLDDPDRLIQVSVQALQRGREFQDISTVAQLDRVLGQRLAASGRDYSTKVES